MEEEKQTSIAVISTQLTGLEKLIDLRLGNQDQQLSLIKDQTTKTNGHVADLYKEVDRLKSWRAFLTGAWAVVTITILPVVMYLLYQRLQK